MPLSLDQLLAFAFAALVLIVMPGPGVLFVVSLQMLVLGAVFAAMALGSDAVWGVLAGALRTWFGRSARRLELMGDAGGLTMIALGVGLAVTGRHD